MNIEIKGILALLAITVFICTCVCTVMVVEQKNMGQSNYVEVLSGQAGEAKGDKQIESLPDKTFAKKAVALETSKNSVEIKDFAEMGLYLLLVLLAPLVMIITLFKIIKGRL